MKMNERKETVQWSYDFIPPSYLTSESSDLKNTENDYYWNLYPFSDSYYNPLNPVILSCAVNFSELGKKKVWTVRDGLIPISIFFRENIPASADQTKILIHRDYWYLVPDKWQEHVKFYEIVAEKTYNSINMPKKLCLFGLPNGAMLDPEDFEEEVKHLSNILGKKNIENMQMTAFFPGKRTDLWGGWNSENFLKYGKSLFQNLKLDINFPEWNTMKMEMNFEDTLYVEFNRGYFLKDTYTKHFFLSRGAGLLESNNQMRPKMNLENTVKLSLYHRMEIYSPDHNELKKFMDPTTDEHFNFFKMIIDKSPQPKSVSASWEKWFGTYLKKYYKIQESKHFDF